LHRLKLLVPFEVIKMAAEDPDRPSDVMSIEIAVSGSGQVHLKSGTFGLSFYSNLRVSDYDMRLREWALLRTTNTIPTTKPKL